jgi:hypothetical protein
MIINKTKVNKVEKDKKFSSRNLVKLDKDDNKKLLNKTQINWNKNPLKNNNYSLIISTKKDNVAKGGKNNVKLEKKRPKLSIEEMKTIQNKNMKEQ